MPKLICGLSKQVVEQNGSTRGASVRLEIELEPTTVRDAPKLKQHIRCGFDRIQEAIEEELARGETGPAESPAPVPKSRQNGALRPLPLR
jgi:hypothetical protein